MLPFQRACRLLCKQNFIFVLVLVLIYKILYKSLLRYWMYFLSNFDATGYFGVHIDQARRDQVDILLREGCMTRGARHENVNAVLAVCLEPEEQPLLIYPLMNEGNLKKFLHRCKMSDVGYNQVVTTTASESCSFQIFNRFFPILLKRNLTRINFNLFWKYEL